MKKLKNKRRNSGKKMVVLLIARLLLSATALAMEPNPHEEELLNAIHEMRVKQEGEEGSVQRVIQQPVMLQTQMVCSPVEQARQRMRDLAAVKEKTVGDVTVNAGHGEVTIDGNSGTIENNVNVQVMNPNERICP